MSQKWCNQRLKSRLRVSEGTAVAKFALAARLPWAVLGGDHTLVRGQRYAATPGANPNIIGMGTRGHRNVAPPLVFNSPPVSQGYVSGSSVTRPTIRK